MNWTGHNSQTLMVGSHAVGRVDRTGRGSFVPVVLLPPVTHGKSWSTPEGARAEVERLVALWLEGLKHA